MTFETKVEADWWLASAVSAQADRSWIDPKAGEVMLRRFAEQWMRSKVDLAPKTQELYRYLLDRLILPTLGDIGLVDLTPARVRAWRAALVRAGRPGPSTVAKSRLDSLETETRTLQDAAHPPEVLAHFEDYDQRLLGNFDRQLDAADTYLAFAQGQPVDGVDLAQAIGDLSDVARQASYYPLDPNQICRTEWAQLLEPVSHVLRSRGVELDVDQHLERRRPDLGRGL